MLELAVIIEDVNGQATAGGCRVLVDNNSTRLKRLNQRIGAYKEAYIAFGLLLLLVSYIPLARFFLRFCFLRPTEDTAAGRAVSTH